MYNYSIYKTYSMQLEHNPALTLVAMETEGNNEFECTINLELTVLGAGGERVVCLMYMLSALDQAVVRSDMRRMLHAQMDADKMLKEVQNEK